MNTCAQSHQNRSKTVTSRLTDIHTDMHPTKEKIPYLVESETPLAQSINIIKINRLTWFSWEKKALTLRALYKSPASRRALIKSVTFSGRGAVNAGARTNSLGGGQWLTTNEKWSARAMSLNTEKSNDGRRQVCHFSNSMVSLSSLYEETWVSSTSFLHARHSFKPVYLWRKLKIKINLFYAT